MPSHSLLQQQHLKATHHMAILWEINYFVIFHIHNLQPEQLQSTIKSSMGHHVFCSNIFVLLQLHLVQQCSVVVVRVFRQQYSPTLGALFLYMMYITTFQLCVQYYFSIS